MAVTVGADRACTVNGCDVVLVQRHDDDVADNILGSVRVIVLKAGYRLLDVDGPLVADAIVGYGAVVVRA